MQQVKRYLGDRFIYAATLEAPSGESFVAAALVLARDFPSTVEVFWDGRVWRNPNEAVTYATRVSQAATSLNEARIIVGCCRLHRCGTNGFIACLDVHFRRLSNAASCWSANPPVKPVP